MYRISQIFLLFLLLTTCRGDTSDLDPENEDRISWMECSCDESLPETIKSEIAAYKPIAERIIEYVINGGGRGKAHLLLKDFITKHYHRPAGSPMLEKGITYLLGHMKCHGLKTWYQNVTVPYWKRGSESAEILEPRKWKLSILALGNSIPTGENGLVAEAVVYRSLDELKAKSHLAKGKIVVMYNDWKNYPYARMHRGDTATEASKAGALAAIVRSATPFSLNTPHTGDQSYVEGVRKIPVVAASVEDVELMYRLYQKCINGTHKLKVSLKLNGHQNCPDQTSRNIFGRLPGTEHPEQRIIISGHSDAWDAGEGAHDDGTGVSTAIEAVLALKALGLRPKRSIEAVAWTSEEVGYYGVDHFLRDPGSDVANVMAGFEADWGFFRPLGFDIAAGEETACIAREIMELLEPLNATLIRRFKTVSSDVSHLLEKAGVPAFGMNTEDERYFWYHHTFADTLNAVNSDDLDIGVAMYAVTSYILADLSVDLKKATNLMKAESSHTK